MTRRLLVAAAAFVALAVLRVATHAGEPRRWLVTEYRPDGAIAHSWVTEHVRRDGCRVELPDEQIELIGGPERLIKIEPWR